MLVKMIERMRFVKGKVCEYADWFYAEQHYDIYQKERPKRFHDFLVSNDIELVLYLPWAQISN